MRHHTSAKLPIEGMESLVVTVSGYKGTERFELIKLIDKAGANHVGNMNESITHLVCWKYEGKKYELARKLKILIVNHRWVEDCFREGRRVPESPYTTKCGKQVGPLLLTVSSVSEFLSGYQSNLQREPKRNEGGLRCEETSNTVISDSDSLNEEWEPPKLNKHRPLREKRKGSSRVQKSVSNKSLLDEPPSWGFLKDEELCSSDSGTLSGKTNSLPASAAPSQKDRKRRLVKKNTTKQALELSSDSEEASVQPFSLHEQHTSTSYASHSDAMSHQNAYNSNLHEFREDFIEDIIDVDKTGDANDVLDADKTRNANDVLDDNDDEDKYLQEIATSQSQVTDVTQKVDSNGDHVTRLPPPAELSCVICWTDFSDTRGVLPCGHRFCFPCIQSWADHMVSSGKTCTCPLCKANFMSITKMGESVPCDQKIYSQTIPVSDSRDDIYILPDRVPQIFDAGPSGAVVCCRCSNGEPEDLLVACNMCQIRYIHSFCQDPPVSPWTCGHCKDLQMLYLRIR